MWYPGSGYGTLLYRFLIFARFLTYIILCQNCYHSFCKILKVKPNLVKLTLGIAMFSHQVMGMISKKCEVWKINHTEYGPFLATDWLKTKGSGRIIRMLII